MLIDLHVHSTFSDGVLAPAELFARADALQLDLLSITDHDTFETYRHIIETKLYPKMTAYLPGIEVSTVDLEGRSQHLLIYFPQLLILPTERELSFTKQIKKDQDFLDTLKPFLRKVEDTKNSRIERAKETFRKLKEHFNIEYDWLEFCQDTGIDLRTDTAIGAIGRPHIAKYLIKHGYCASIEDAFSKYLGDDSPAYTMKRDLPLYETIAEVIGYGGIPVLAHPLLKATRTEASNVIQKATTHGLLGLEVYHPCVKPTDWEYLLTLTEELNLIPTIGSDFHSDESLIKKAEVGYLFGNEMYSDEKKLLLIKRIFSLHSFSLD
ncbi:putative Metal-dependent phosphoesterase [Giardia muris]|uniref:Putative Metal-dependent phosphoesterase n=1 Tax=Giardia muris TaxID=5742 RepID=A0A4Z1T6N4_GIAMU|nr:putative Metal-dependent phosphoesterase [Giardia muris]|eukprot:TNJ28199.1 putative Metal-dependent phosphoesterase [Giardia muris]